MLKQYGRGVVGGFMVIAVAVALTASVGAASVTSSFQSIWVRATHDLALAGCTTGIPPCSDQEDDLTDPQGDDEQCSGVGGGAGPGLHVNIANGNVWTEYHVFTTYGAGEEAMSLTLTYNSLLSNIEAGTNDTQSRIGHGWKNSEDLGYFLLDAVVDGGCFPSTGIECVLGEGTPVCVREDGPVGGNCVPPGGTSTTPARCLQGCACHEEFVPGEICGATLSPPRVVVVDGDGKQHVFYLGAGTYGSSPWQNAEMRVATPANGGEAGIDDLVLIYPDGSKRFFGTSGRVTRTVTARGLAIRYAYDLNKPKRLISQTDGFGRKVEFEYDEIDVAGVNHGRLVAIVHPDSTAQIPVRTELHYDNSSDPFLLTSIEDPMGELTQFEYETTPYPVDHDNNASTPDRLYYRMTKETLRNGRIFGCEYVDTESLDKRIITAYDPDTSSDEVVLRIESEMFPEHRNQESETDVEIHFFDGRSNQWTYLRNHWYQLTSRILANSTKYTTTVYYDVLPTFDPSNPETGNPSAGRSARVFYPLGLEKHFEYKSRGRTSTKTVKVPIFAGSPTKLDYITIFQFSDDFPGTFPAYYDYFKGLPVWKQQPDGGIWEYEYNDKGDVTLIKDPIEETPTDGVQTFQYDYFGDEEDLPPGLPMGTKLSGRLKEVRQWDRRGYKTVLQYNGQGHLTTKEVFLDLGATECITTEYGYDTMGRRTSETVHRGDATVTTTKYEYDVLGRMTKMIENFTSSQTADPEIFNLTTQYGYDEHGNMNSMVNPRGTRTEYGYDHQNRLEQIIEDAGLGGMAFETNYILDGNGNIDTMTDAENRVTEYEYDVANFVVKIKDPEGYHTKYQRDPKGNVEEMWRQRNLADIEEDWELVESTIYDGLSRVHKRTPSDAPTMTYDYGYGSTGGGGGGGCGCSSGFGSSIPYKTIDEEIPPTVTYNEVDLLGRVCKVIRKYGDSSPTPDADDSVTVYAYDPEGNMTQMTGPEGEVTTMTYDGAGRMATRTVSADPFDALVTSYVYNGVGNVKQITLPTTHVMQYEYDEADRLKRVHDAEGEIAFYTRDANGNVVTRADGNGNAWTYVYDALDRMTEMHDPLVETPHDGVIKFEYDQTGNLIERENRNVNQEVPPYEGVKTRYFYDDNDRLRRVVEDYVEADFDENALCGSSGSQQVQDGSGEGGIQGGGILQGGGGSPGGGPTTGTEISSTPTTNSIITYEYDGRHLIKIYDHDCNVTEYFHDTFGRLTGINYPTCADCPDPQVQFSYQGTSLREFTRRDQRLVECSYHFDELGRLTGRDYYKNGPERSEAFSYDRSSRLVAASGTREIFDPINGPQTLPLNSWERGYDQAGRPMAEWQTHPGSPSQSYETNVSYMLNTTDKTLSQEMCYPDCGTRIVSRVWDGRGRVKSANAGTDIGADWTFDAGNRRIGEFRRNGSFNFSQFNYDVNDRMTGLTHFSYMGGIDPTVIANLDYGYDAEGNREFTENYLATDRGEAYDHDNRNRLVMMSRGLLSTNSAGEVVVEDTDLLNHPTLVGRQDWVSLDHRGNWKDFRDTVAGNPARTETRVANGVNEYTSINPGTPGSTLATKTLAYDKAGNLTFNRWARNVGDPCGRTPLDSECVTAGNCVATKVGCNLGQEYEYDVENRLARIRRDTNDAPEGAVSQGGQGKDPETNVLIEFVYDTLGRRVETIEYVDAATGAVTDGVGSNPGPRRTRHVYLGLEMIQEYACNDNWPCTTELPLAREFVYGDPARYPEVVAMITHHLDPVHTENYHYLHDVLGSVIGLVDDAGELVERYTYDPYGKVFIEKWDAAANGGSGAWATSETNCGSPTCGKLPVSSVGNPFMWTGHRYDAAVGLYATHFRTYSPTLGRWLQRDPIEYKGGSINLYEYVASSPLFWIDPFGLESFRQLVEEGYFDDMLDRLWNASMKHENEKGFWIYGVFRRGPFWTGNSEGVHPGNPPRGAIGHVHTHPKEYHDRGPSQQDQGFASRTGKPGIVLIRDPANPRKYIPFPYGPDLDKQIPCDRLFGKSPPGVHYELDATGHCISVIDDEKKLKDWCNKK